jgi:hypothetical protein
MKNLFILRSSSAGGKINSKSSLLANSVALRFPSGALIKPSFLLSLLQKLFILIFPN